MTIGERIKLHRKKLGLSADALAQKIGVDRATIYRYEKNDIKKFPTTVLEPLAAALHTTPAYLMGWRDKNGEKASTFDPADTAEEPMAITSPKEKSLVRDFRSLNDDGQSKAASYVSDLTSMDKYTRQESWDGLAM